jgi:hypothetical protein
MRENPGCGKLIFLNSNEENEETKKLKILINMPPHEINIKNQLEGKELFTNKDLGEYFYF